MPSPVLSYVAIVLSFSGLFQYAEAVSPTRAQDLTAVSNNSVTDPCNQLNDSSKREEKRAADRACGQAFLALDENDANSCRGWRQPACRLLPSFPNQQCSCLIVVCNQAGVTSDETKSFRECASDLRTDWYFTEQAAQASGFKELFKKVESSSKGAQAQSSYNSLNVGGSNGGGSSNVPNTSYGTGVPGGAASQHGTGTPWRHKCGIVGKTFTCNVCNNVYHSVSALKNHQRRHTEDLQCKICQKQCTSRTNFQRHIKGVHKGNEAAASTKDPNLIKELLEAYNATKPHVCGVCGARFGAVGSLYNHKTIHDDSEPTTCEECKRTFSTPSNYRSHMRLRH